MPFGAVNSRKLKGFFEQRTRASVAHELNILAFDIAVGLIRRHLDSSVKFKLLSNFAVNSVFVGIVNDVAECSSKGSIKFDF